MLEAADLSIWIGAEPTFTDRFSQQPEWLDQALGESKLRRAGRLLRRLGASWQGALVMRCIGRQYAGETRPRWSLGLYGSRDGEPVWDGPPDPLLVDRHLPTDDLLPRFWTGLSEALNAKGWPATTFSLPGDPLHLRILFSLDGHRPTADPRVDARLAAPSVHSGPIPVEGLSDEMASEGLYLLKLGTARSEGENGESICLELPGFPDTATFRQFITVVEGVAAETAVPRLIWQGYPPPVDATVMWTTLTPDPAVIEVNLAPAADVAGFLRDMRRLFAAASDEALAPFRLQYNGQVTDSGGGGQFTLGGPEPLSSPFVMAPQTLPRLIRYLIRHPSLSYWFAPAYVGSSSQSPRPDEGVRDAYEELELALQQLAREASPGPEFIWRSLNNFLVDPSGNSHRSELNIEKFWNPYLPQRGCLGLVEFRAFRMVHDAEQAAAIAALLRALVAMLSAADRAPELTDWGETLHDRFALPHYMQRDLGEVFADLADCGLELGSVITDRLLSDPHRELARHTMGDCTLIVEQAVEFWPLLGDTAMQASGDSRLVDASTSRLQLMLRPGETADGSLEHWQLWIGGHQLPLREERDQQGRVRLFGVRYRSFMPLQGLHPGVPVQSPLEFCLWDRRRGRGFRLIWHEWRPEGGPYDGVPDSLDEACQRRHERLVVEPIDTPLVAAQTDLPGAALSAYCLDLRYL